MTARAALLLALLPLAGCAPGVSVPAPPPVGTEVPDLRGTWAGSWGGQPASLLVIEQADEGTERGVHLGSWQILGEWRPNIVGILTYTDRGAAISTNARGWVGGGPRGTLSLVVAADSGGGPIVLDLRLAGDRLTGTGQSPVRWGPYGAVELRRQ